MRDALHIIAAGIGAVLGFICGLPPILIVLCVVMTLDFVTGVIVGCTGHSPKTEYGGLSSSTAFIGLMKKVAILIVVALAYLLDYAVTSTSGIDFAAVSGATCLWFVASEGISIVENAALMGVPIPDQIRQLLEVMKGKKEV